MGANFFAMNYADDIKRAVSMKDVCAMYGIEVNRGGFARCPFHSDRKPSMKVYDGNRGFCCFVCDTKGSVLDFVMRFFNLSFKEACAKLNTDFRLGLPIGEKLSKEEQQAADREARKRRAEIDRVKREGERITKRYHVALDRYIALDRVLTANKPQSENDITEEYAQALRQIPIAKYNLEVAEIALYNFEHRNDNS